jgi:uncharacterized protein YxjI
MPIDLFCSCGRQLRIRDDLAGRKIRCPGCQEVLRATPGTEPPQPKAARPEQKTAPAPKAPQKAVSSREPAKTAPSPRAAKTADSSREPAKTASAPKAPKKVESSRELEEEDFTSEPVESSIELEEEDSESEPTEEGDGSGGLLSSNRFVVKEQSKLLSANKTFEISDDTGEVLGTAKETRGWFAVLMSMFMGKDNMSLTVELRQKSDDAVVFSVRRKGFFFKKIQVLDGDGKVVGAYKAKLFSLTGGFHIYDAAGKHVSDIKGQWFKAEYNFFTPKGNTKMGTVSKKWGGLVKELFTDDRTYGVEIAPDYHDDPTTKILILGAAFAINVMFKQSKESTTVGSSSSSISSGGGDED